MGTETKYSLFLVVINYNTSKVITYTMCKRKIVLSPLISHFLTSYTTYNI